MKNYKIYVYAIAKNEEKFAKRWVESMSEADGIFVLDTGSTDKTVEILLENGAAVKSAIISPFRFDTARNLSLAMLPKDTDICVCTDLDEIFEKGWRNAVERAWKENTTRLNYRYTWSFLKDGKEGVVFYTNKIHKMNAYVWKHPVHEVLYYNGSGKESCVTSAEIKLFHFADSSKSRSSYLPLLELAVSEDPLNDRNMHYLGREYMFKGEYEKSIETLKRHLELPSSVWKDERCASMRYIARCCLKKGKTKEAESWFFKACAEAPYLREPFCELAELYYSLKNWEGVIFFVNKALKIKERPVTYVTEPSCYNSFPYDILSVAYYNENLLEKSLSNALLALSLDKNNERIKKNIEFIKAKLAEKNK